MAMDSRKWKRYTAINRYNVISKYQFLKIQCDELWKECVKIKAGYRSEISGRSKDQGFIMGAHHVFGKVSNALRYDLRNGICLDNNGEHINGVHNKYNYQIANEYAEIIRQKIIEREGVGIFEKLNQLKWITKIDLQLVKIKLEEEKKRLLSEKKQTVFNH